MRRTMMLAAVSALGLLAACDTSTEPSPPPASQDALTTATSAPPEEEAVSSSSPPAQETGLHGDEEPGDFTPSGAESAVQKYVETLSAVHLGETDISELRALSVEGCATCAAFVSAAQSAPQGTEYVRIDVARAVLSGPTARVETVLVQIDGDKEISTIFNMIWGDEQWLVEEIVLSAD